MNHSKHPPTSILNPAFKYVPSANTNLRETFRRVREHMQGKEPTIKPPDTKNIFKLKP